MRRFCYVIAIFLTLSQTLFADKYTWIIENAPLGKGILFGPQGYIEGEFNFDNLFVTAPEGANIVSPTDGILVNAGIGYLSEIQKSTAYKAEGKTINQMLTSFSKRPSNSVPNDLKYVTGRLGIRTTDGRVVYLRGLKSDREFKTGQPIKRGERLGTIGYSYHKIKEPSVCISIEKQSKVDDPMAPFGLKSSFKYPTELKPIESLTKEQAKEDVRVCIEALKEMYPGLSNLMTMDDVDQFATSLYGRIDAEKGEISFSYFVSIIRSITAKIHDSHLYMINPEWHKKTKEHVNRPPILMGWYNKRLICYNAFSDNWQLIGREIKAVNGISADSLKQFLSQKQTNYDAQASKIIDLNLALYGFEYLFEDERTHKYNFDMLLEMVDGEKISLNGLPLTDNRSLDFLPYSFLMINREHEGYKPLILNDSTAYLGISTFSLNQLQVENIGKFIASITGNKENLIIDVRNNGGGVQDVLSTIYSYIAGEPFRINSYSKVNKRGNFNYFDYTTNCCGLSDQSYFGEEYVAEAGKEGYYARDEQMMIKADSVINFKGRVYVLANERSVSAAALFPAMLVRGHRGVVVGRETSTAYHFMNALKFAQLRLPHSSIMVNVPLVGCYFDTVVNDRVPYGRGVLPDYEIPLTLDEVRSTHGDAILNYTLKLIEENKYLPAQNPFLK